MEAAVSHIQRLNSRYYNFPTPLRLHNNYINDYLPQQNTNFLQQYLNYYNEPTLPLDLSVKSNIPITPPCTPPPAAKRKIDEPKTTKPPKLLRHFEDTDTEIKENKDEESPEAKKLKFTKQFFEELETCLPKISTPTKPESPDIVENDVEDRPKKASIKTQPLKKSKAVRRLMFDEDKTSPVSGTIIRDLDDDDENLVVRKGDIDPAFNVVEVTEEAKALIASIDNRLGRYICRLCRKLYSDAFALAQHRCSRIVHIEYRCPECDKVFNCPANLASHRRWHKPRVPSTVKRREPASENGHFPCKQCGKLFRRQAYLKKHMLAHEQPGEDKEPSAFRQVHTEFSSYNQDLTRDSNYNTFWNKLPIQQEFSWATRPPSSCSSGDSRSLDVTGSEDEGGSGDG